VPHVPGLSHRHRRMETAGVYHEFLCYRRFVKNSGPTMFHDFVEIKGRNPRIQSIDQLILKLVTARRKLCIWINLQDCNFLIIGPVGSKAFCLGERHCKARYTQSSSSF
jgi:hypothetical protein